jgi:phage terminase large subunit GpA-like protein
MSWYLQCPHCDKAIQIHEEPGLMLGRNHPCPHCGGTGVFSVNDRGQVMLSPPVRKPPRRGTAPTTPVASEKKPAHPKSG